MSRDDDRSRNVAPESARAVQQSARDLLRRWMRDYDDGIERGFDGLGRDAIRHASDTAARLSRPDSAVSAAAVLKEVEALAESLQGPAGSRRRWWPSRPAIPPKEDRFEAIVQNIDRQRDEAARATILLRTDRARFTEAEAGLTDMLQLLQALHAAVEAAVREVRGQDPARASRLQDEASMTLLERERDLTTQLAVTRQGLMTLDVLIANQTALDAALERARTATVSALRVAVAARRATAQSREVAGQAEVLARMAAAADDPAASTDHARRMLDDAVAQARAALDAMRVAPGC